ncbi:HAD family hydrolase [Myroides profundi]|uniref:phosphoglycolate phosphatase n=1 Tax=Myroides profundi TaxID=480520 RepID=A0AAJ5BE54_MYRPR|nr:HAD-IA family hydrolase [Myroides profundi]AJH14527.1 phosphoglycolate phosphatase [Myroides profundi]SEQ93745.1 pyrophosphatase PpaX [Myroides profundi]
MDKELVIFDLDQTLVDTSMLEALRRQRQWNTVYRDIDKTRVYESIKESVDFLLNQNIKVAVFTSSPKSYAQKVLNHHNLNYDLLLGYHDVRHRKPSPEGFIKILDHFKVESQKAISFGDQHTDIVGSEKAGIKTVGCLWGNLNNNLLIESKPSIILESSQEIFDCIML